MWLTKISVLNLEGPPKHSELPCTRSANGFKMLATSLSLSLSHSGKMPGHHFYPRRNMSKCRDWRCNQLRLSTHDASPITFQLRGTRLDVIGLAPCVLISLNIWTFGKFLTLHVTSSLYTHTHVRFAHSLDTNMVPYILITSYHLANHSYQWNSLTL